MHAEKLAGNETSAKDRYGKLGCQARHNLLGMLHAIRT